MPRWNAWIWAGTPLAPSKTCPKAEVSWWGSLANCKLARKSTAHGPEPSHWVRRLVTRIWGIWTQWTCHEARLEIEWTIRQAWTAIFIFWKIVWFPSRMCVSSIHSVLPAGSQPKPIAKAWIATTARVRISSGLRTTWCILLNCLILSKWFGLFCCNLLWIPQSKLSCVIKCDENSMSAIQHVIYYKTYPNGTAFTFFTFLSAAAVRCYVPFRWGLNSPGRLRCRRCGCHHTEHQMLDSCMMLNGQVVTFHGVLCLRAESRGSWCKRSRDPRESFVVTGLKFETKLKLKLGLANTSTHHKREVKQTVECVCFPPPSKCLLSTESS